MKVELRDYQAEALEQARGHIRAGARAVLINAPTGSGKTVIAAALMELIIAKGNRANFVVDRLSLIGQTSATFDRYGLEQHGVIQAAHPRYRPSMPIQLCSIQTLGRRGWPPAAVDVFDEAHVLHAAHKARVEQRSSVVVGLTATPFTRGLGKWFDAVVNVTTTRKLIEAKWLVPYRAFSCAAPDMTGVAIKAGEYDEKESSSRALQVVGDVVAEYLQHGDGRKFICSAVDVRHVEELQRQFLAAGVNAARFTYREDEAEREDVTAEFRKPDSTIRGLITVTAASRGFDVPDVACVIMARPLRKSLAEHIQLLGRGLRIAEGKTDCLVLDHAGNMRRFWEDCEAFFDDGIDKLDDGKPRVKQQANPKSEAEPMKCPSCALLHRPAPFCPDCGHEYPRRQSVQHAPGTLSELLATGTADTLRAKLWPQIVGYVLPKANGDMERAQRKAQAIYRELTGAFARGRVESTVPMPPTRELRNRIISNQIRWAKSRESAAEVRA